MAFVRIEEKYKLYKMAKLNQMAQDLMKKHGKSEIYAAGNHLYFDKKNALITANGDEDKVETIKADEYGSDNDGEQNLIPTKRTSVRNKNSKKVDELDPSQTPEPSVNTKSGQNTNTENPE